MKTKLLTTFMLLLMLCTATMAETVEIDGINYDLQSYNSTAWVKSKSPKYKGDIAIPESVTYNGKTYIVTGIDRYAFSGCTGLTSIEIPNSVTYMGYYAFDGCTGLTSISIPEGMTSMGEHSVFEGCTGLTSVTIPESVTSIGSSTFSGCIGLTSITIPESVTSIEYSAFSGCTGLTSITIPNSVTSIGWRAFYGCTGLTSITIPNSVTSIGSDAFYGCIRLKSPVYTSYVFAYMPTSYNGAYSIPDGIETIANSAFKGCESLTRIEIPNSVTSIGQSAFYRCTGLTSITIPESVTSIGSSAFEGCTGLTSITIPNSVTSIGSSAFEGCTGLTSITIPNSVTSIGSYAFEDCTGLTSVTIPNSVTSIGDGAFYKCSSLTSIDIPNSVTSIGSNAFYGCTGLTSITVEDGNTEYDSRDNCNAIIETATNSLIAGCQNTVIPNSVTSIGQSAFSGCTGLTSIEIPNSVTSIGNYAFSGCTGLTSIEIPNSVTSIGREAFSDCTGLTSITCHALTPPSINYSYYYISSSSTPLIVPCQSVEAYKNANGWKNFANISGYGEDIHSFVQNIVLTAGDNLADAEFECIDLSAPQAGEGETQLADGVLEISLDGGEFQSIDPNAPLYTLDAKIRIRYDALEGNEVVYSDALPLNIERKKETHTESYYNAETPYTITLIDGTERQVCYNEETGESVNETFDIITYKDLNSEGDQLVEVITHYICTYQRMPEIYSHWTNKYYDGSENFCEGGDWGFYFGDTYDANYGIDVWAGYECDEYSWAEVGYTYEGEGIKIYNLLLEVKTNNGWSELGDIGYNHYSTSHECRLTIGTEVGIFYRYFDISVNYEGCTEYVGYGCPGSTVTFEDGHTMEVPESYDYYYYDEDYSEEGKIYYVEIYGSPEVYIDHSSIVMNIGENIGLPNVSISDNYYYYYTSPITAKYWEVNINNGGWTEYEEGTPINEAGTALLRYTVETECGDIVSSDAVTVTVNNSFDPDHPTDPSKFMLELTAEPEDLGTVVNGGLHPQKQEVTFSAVPNEGSRFIGWSDGDSNATRTIMLVCDTAFTAYFEPDEYTVTFVDYDNSVLQQSSVKTGEMPEYLGATPERKSNEGFAFTFAGWEPEIVPVVASATYTAVYDSIAFPDTVYISDRKDLAQMFVGPVTHVIATETADISITSPVTVKSLTLRMTDGRAPSVDNLENLTADVIDMVLRLEPEKDEAVPSKWYVFGVPFEVPLSTNFRAEGSDAPAVMFSHYVIDEYDGALCAAKSNGWKRVEAGATLKPGNAYMISVNGTGNLWRLTKQGGSPVSDSDAVSVTYHASSTGAHHAGWNGIANPMWVSALATMQGLEYATIYHNVFSVYETLPLDESAFANACPLFVQTAADGTVEFTAANAGRMPVRRNESAENSDVRLTLSLTDNGIPYTDKAYLTLSPDADGSQYTIGGDLEKMMTANASVPQLWITAYGTSLAAHVMPPLATMTLPIGLYAPKHGDYTFDVSGIPSGMEILLTQDGSVVWNLTLGDCQLQLGQGDNSGYALVIKLPGGTVTGLDEVHDADGDQTVKYIERGIIYIRHKGITYDTQGKKTAK